MKKVYTTIFLFISLFFFYSNNVKAQSYTFTDKFFNYDYSFYWDMEKVTINKTQELNLDYYVMLYFGGNPRVYIGNNFTVTSYTQSSSGVYYIVSCSDCSYFNFVDNSLVLNSTVTTFNIPLYSTPYFIFGSNYNFIHNGAPHSFTYNSTTFYLNNGDKFPTYFDMLNYFGFTINQPEQEDIHSEEKEILSGFYTLVIEKLNIFTTSIFSNYIYLSVFGIFILIFIIALIRRLL